MTIWTGYFLTGGLGMVAPSLGLLDPLIYLLWFFWCVMKSLLYNTLVNSKMDLVAQISIAAVMIRETYSIFKHIH